MSFFTLIIYGNIHHLICFAHLEAIRAERLSYLELLIMPIRVQLKNHRNRLSRRLEVENSWPLCVMYLGRTLGTRVSLKPTGKEVSCHFLTYGCLMAFVSEF